MTTKGENKPMEKNKNNHINWLGLRLTKKRTIYLTVISSIGLSFFAVAISFAVPVLIYARINIYPFDKLTYTYTLLLSLSNLIANAICICIFSLTLYKAKSIRKALKKQSIIEVLLRKRIQIEK